MGIGFVVLAAYLLGSVPFAVVVSRLLGLQDPRSYGSGNPGATNVLRSGSRKAAALTLLFDAAKGVVAVWVAGHWGIMVAACAGLAVFLGHVYSVFLRFKGGKGVATALGVLLALDWRVALCVLTVWLLVALITRYSSLAAILAALCAPVLSWLWMQHLWITVCVTVMSVILIWRHRGNIRKLLDRQEAKIMTKKRSDA